MDYYGTFINVHVYSQPRVKSMRRHALILVQVMV